MDKLIREDLDVQSERSLLVCVVLPESRLDPYDPLAELRSLTRTAGGEVVDEMLAKRQRIDPAHYVGSGKAEEIGLRAKACDADVVIFDNDLSPAQIRDLERLIDRKVIDRSELILDIFAARAQTHEARLQVELAQLEYTFPRLRHMWSHLERIGGGASAVGGIGTRGPGEKQIEIDRRLVKKRVTELKRSLAAIDKRKVRTVRSRAGMFKVCLVGYTNAGKSTLMNTLTGSKVLAEDKLFATLDTKTRRWNLGEGQTALLSDTVGFVRDLPHHLVASFKATLEEAIHADLLLHVADASHDDVQGQIDSVNQVLAELGCDRKDQLLLLNKTDKLVDPAALPALIARYGEAVGISAVSGVGADQLIDKVLDRMRGLQERVRLRADCRNGRLMQYLAQHADVNRQSFDNATVEMEAVMGARHVADLAQFAPDVAVLDREQLT